MSAEGRRNLQRWFIFMRPVSFFLPDESAQPLCPQCFSSNKAQTVKPRPINDSKCTNYSTTFPADVSWVQCSILGSCTYQYILLKAHGIWKTFDFCVCCILWENPTKPNKQFLFENCILFIILKGKLKYSVNLIRLAQKHISLFLWR